MPMNFKNDQIIIWATRSTSYIKTYQAQDLCTQFQKYQDLKSSKFKSSQNSGEVLLLSTSNNMDQLHYYLE